MSYEQEIREKWMTGDYISEIFTIAARADEELAALKTTVEHLAAQGRAMESELAETRRREQDLKVRLEAAEALLDGDANLQTGRTPDGTL